MHPLETRLPKDQTVVNAGKKTFVRANGAIIVLSLPRIFYCRKAKVLRAHYAIARSLIADTGKWDAPIPWY
jgi:hypothetical protein